MTTPLPKKDKSMLTLKTKTHIAMIDDDGNVFVDSRKIGSVRYDHGFSRWVVAPVNGKTRHLNMLDRDSSGDDVVKRGAKWLMKTIEAR
jgi:hypothetical protein